MTNPMKIKRCGGCHFAKIVVHDLTKRICFGAPPSAIQMPASNGRMTMQMSRPFVSVSDDACALYQSKDVADVERDDAAMMEVQNHPDLFRTKQ